MHSGELGELAVGYFAKKLDQMLRPLEPVENLALDRGIFLRHCSYPHARSVAGRSK